MRTEQQALKTSLAAILVLAALGIGFGLISGSSAIVFDGVFSLVDAGMSLISIVTVNLIVRSTQPHGLPERLNRRFTMGFWHFEPIVLAVSALLTMSVAAYAFVQSVSAVLTGGRDVEFGPAIVYAVVVLALTITIGMLEHRANRRLGSAFVAMDVKSWVMGAGITGALLVAFLVGLAITGTRFAWMVPYVDPAVLMLVSLVLFPLPITNLREAVAQIALIAPPDLRDDAESLAARTAAEEGFLDHRVYVARVGRGHEVEINFVVPRGRPPRALEEWDAVRERVAANWVPTIPTTG